VCGKVVFSDNSSPDASLRTFYNFTSQNSIPKRKDWVRGRFFNNRLVCYDNVALTQNVGKSKSSSLRKPEITAETDDDTSIRTPEPCLTVAFAIEI
jgi:hypothetical protein